MWQNRKGRPKDCVDSMNDLLDKYNKWNAGGDCTTRDLLKSGVTLPKGW